MVNAAALDTEINELIVGFLAECAVPVAQLPADETDFVADLMFDSLDFVTLVTRVEERWGITVSVEQSRIENFATVGAVRAFVRAAVGGR